MLSDNVVHAKMSEKLLTEADLLGSVLGGPDVLGSDVLGRDLFGPKLLFLLVARV